MVRLDAVRLRPSELLNEFSFSVLMLSRTVVLVAVCFLVACSAAPKQELVAKRSDARAPEKNERYETKEPSVPSVVMSLIEQAKTLTSEQRFDKAIQLLEQAQRIAPNYSRIYLNLGRIYSEQGEPEAARQMFHRAESLAVNEQERREARRALSNERMLWP